MGPKQKNMTSSTPAVKNPTSTFTGLSDNSGPSTINETSSFEIANNVEIAVTQPTIPKVRTLAVKQPTIPKVTTWELICKAIETIGVARKGASYLAIQKWIINNKENVHINRLKANMKKAIVKALESGLLKRPSASKNVTGLRGYFMLIKDLRKTKAKPIAPKPKATVKLKTATAKTAAMPKTATAKTAAIPKTATAKTAAIPKTATAKTAAIPKTATDKTAAIPKTTAPKPKAAVKPKSDTEKEPQVKPNTKVGKTKPTEEVTSSKPKPKAVTSNTDTKEETNAKRKTKAVATKTGAESGSSDKENAEVKSNPGKDGPKAEATGLKPILDDENLPVPKPKVLLARVNGVKRPTQREVDPQSEINQTKPTKPKKIPKITAKPANSTKNSSKDIRPRKLYSSRLNPPTNISRKDLSDTELHVKRSNRKSLKSYSSDTEVEAIKRIQDEKSTKSKKIAKAKKVNEAGPSNSRLKIQKSIS